MRSIDAKAAYLQELHKRRKDSRIYRDYQQVGLELAEILGDPEHKSLYIKLAKTKDPGALLGLARDIASRKNVKNSGAYFMRLVSQVHERNPDHRP